MKITKLAASFIWNSAMKNFISEQKDRFELIDGRNSQTDYFPGYFVKTIKQVINHLGSEK